jgi:hypothetical protein
LQLKNSRKKPETNGAKKKKQTNKIPSISPPPQQRDLTKQTKTKTLQTLLCYNNTRSSSKRGGETGSCTYYYRGCLEEREPNSRHSASNEIVQEYKVEKGTRGM